MTDLTGVATGWGRSVGRYFSIVSALPSVLLVAWVFLLVSSGAIVGRPDPRAAVLAAASLSVGSLGALALVALALGVVLHPLQFATVQFLEGYWGVSGPAQRMRAARIVRHRRRLNLLRGVRDDTEKRMNELPPDPRDDRLEERVPLMSLHDEADRLTSEQPEELAETMPTRLGNVLRFYEWRVGRP